MTFPGKREFTVEALSAWRVADKLARENVTLYRLTQHTKNLVSFAVNGKDVKKVFAILRGSCYNVVKVCPFGASRLFFACFRRAGFISGVLLFALFVLLFQTRVLKISVTGSGAYYENEVLGILRAHGVQPFSSRVKDENALTAEILALPRVVFCSTRMQGGVFTVTVEVADEDKTLHSQPLTAPVAGTVEELTVIRGSARVSVGQQVREGEVLVDGGFTEQVGIVIARAVIAHSFEGEYEGSEEQAVLSAGLFFGELKEIHTEKSGNGWRVYGIALRTVQLNLG